MKAVAKEIIKSHRFFIRESYPYSRIAFIRHPLQWIRAYWRFMSLSIVAAFSIASCAEYPIAIAISGDHGAASYSAKDGIRITYQK